MIHDSTSARLPEGQLAFVRTGVVTACLERLRGRDLTMDKLDMDPQIHQAGILLHQPFRRMVRRAKQKKVPGATLR